MNDPGSMDWMKQWQSLSGQYWRAWQDFARESGGPAVAGAPWHEGLEQWSRMFAKPAQQSETIERLLASAKSFTTFAQSMLAAATAAGSSTPWTEALRKGFEMPGMPSAFANPLAQALRDVSGKGAEGFKAMMENLGASLDPTEQIKSWLRAPAFGFLREHQEHYQRMASAMLDYQEQNARYNALILKASQQGFERFESKLAAHEEPGRQIDSLRALYDVWVDAAEEAYAEIALSAEFREVYGALVNAQMRVRSELQKEVERVATDFGMPTRSEIDSIGQRLHDLRRELRNGGGGASASVARDIAALKREVAALKSELAGRAAKPSPRASDERTATPPAKPLARKQRAKRKKKQAKKAVALKVERNDAVRTLEGVSGPKRAGGAERKAGRGSRKESAKKKKTKSIGKTVHRPSRTGDAPASFAARMAAFAQSSRRASRRSGLTPAPEARKTSKEH